MAPKKKHESNEDCASIGGEGCCQREGAAGSSFRMDCVNNSDEEWSIRRDKRLAEMAKYEDKWPFAYALASLLQTHDDNIGLIRRTWIKNKQRKGRMLPWPNPENRNVGKRMWESQAGAARHCLDGSAILYFKFWALCTGVMTND